jgi:DNA-binding NarL/FixJ family response regulator
VVISKPQNGTHPESTDEAVHLAASIDFQLLLQTLEPWAPEPPCKRKLTRRHQEILQLVAKGQSTDEVATNLSITPKTVENHLCEIYRRLTARNVVDAVLRAVRAGLIAIPTE